MKQTIKIKKINKNIATPEISKKGDWIDLRAAKDIAIAGPYTVQARKDKDRKVIFDSNLVPLGIAIELPKGYEAVVDMRSSAFKNYCVILANSQGIIDNTYNGDDDQWFAHLIALHDAVICEGDRICQFRIQLSQKATVWQKLKWLFSSGVKIKVVENLGNKNRGGHGSTGRR